MKKSLLTLAVLSTLIVPAVQAEIKCSKKVNSRHEKLILRDLERLKGLQFSGETSEEDLKILGVDKVDSVIMSQWLNNRVQYIIDDSEQIDRLKLDIAERYFAYPDAGILPDMETAGKGPVFVDSTTEKGQAVTVMSNIGTVLYVAGKSSGQLLQVKIPLSLFKADKVRVTSPRTGIIQIGEGLFMKKFMFNEGDKDALSNTISRLSTFFHEARHSDGHGKTLGFMHAVCPTGHDFAGLNACDRNLNGPYSVGRVMEKEFIKACTDCSESEKEKIRLSMIDSDSRVLKSTRIVGASHDSEASMLQTMISMYEGLLTFTPEGPSRAQYVEKINQLKAQLEQIASQSGNVVEVPSKFWDATPEGNR